MVPPSSSARETSGCLSELHGREVTRNHAKLPKLHLIIQSVEIARNCILELLLFKIAGDHFTDQSTSPSTLNYALPPNYKLRFKVPVKTSSSLGFEILLEFDLSTRMLL